MKQYLIVEVWEYTFLTLNKFIGSKMIEYIDIIKGNTQQTILIEGTSEDGKTSILLRIIILFIIN